MSTPPAADSPAEPAVRWPPRVAGLVSIGVGPLAFGLGLGLYRAAGALGVDLDHGDAGAVVQLVVLALWFAGALAGLVGGGAAVVVAARRAPLDWLAIGLGVLGLASAVGSAGVMVLTAGAWVLSGMNLGFGMF